MKGILIILSLFLSCLFSGSGVSRNAAWERPREAAVLESAEQDTKDRDADFKKVHTVKNLAISTTVLLT
ncbi:MAG: hypothetical protein MJY56_03230 [Bacteroidales bacterium]|nr:hypothetical protein [Bacteroidales bacterium]